MIALSQSFVVATELQKVAEQNGYRRALGVTDGWARYGSTTAKGTVWFAAAGNVGPWFLAIDHDGVVEELGQAQVDLPGPGLARYAFPSLTALYAAMSRVYQLGVTLPDGPLQEFREVVRDLPQSTEAERLVIQRVGQDIFRDRLMKYWGGSCPLTGITDPALLRASHIKPWARCENDAERLDVHNGLLLSALWDAAFDAGLVTFDDDGSPIFSNLLTTFARNALVGEAMIRFNEKHQKSLAWHRENIFQKSEFALGD